MPRLHFLPGLHYQLRSLFAMLLFLLAYCLWLWLLDLLAADTTPDGHVAQLLLPLVPVSLFDIGLRLSWEPQTPRLKPPPPAPLARLFLPECGLFWFPMLIMIPLWVWGFGLIGWTIADWLTG